MPKIRAEKTGAEPEGEGFLSQLSMLWRAFLASPLRNAILAISAGILLLLLATAYGQVILNRWNKPFYDAIERRDLPGFFGQLLVFAQIAGLLLVLNVVQTWLNQMLHLKLREGLTRDLIGQWMQPHRAVRLANAGAIGVNPDQRVHEDTRHLADLSADLGVGLLQATILLFSFVGVLWAISDGFIFQVWGRDVAIPGYMVWAAVLYAGAASCLSWLAGRPLIRLQSERYSREAVLRCSLMRVSEHSEAIALAAGEGNEKQRLERDLASVIGASRNIIHAVVRLTCVTAGYGWITVVAPIVIASPVYFSGRLSFGGLMMAAAAFSQVHASLRWFVDRIGAIADWRATLLRVATFRAAVLRAGASREEEAGIVLGEADGCLSLEMLAIAAPEGTVRLSLADARIAAGERVGVCGAPAMRKALFKAVAGVWSSGSGRIGLPKGEEVAFVPATPYFPAGTIREALAYPADPRSFTDVEVVAALTKTGLVRLVAMAGRDARWDRELNDDDRRLLAFARLLLHKPRWIVIGEALDLLRDDARRNMIEMLARDLPQAAIVNIGESSDLFFARRMELQGVEPAKVASHESIAVTVPGRRRRPSLPLALAVSRG